LSWAFAHVRCASFGERLIVSGISVRVGIPVSSCPLLFSLPDSLVPVRGFRPKLLGKLGSLFARGAAGFRRRNGG
jgi:hypothetical protein